MALLGGISRFLDKYLFGYALGVAAGPSLEPFVQVLANEAWEANQVRPLHPQTMTGAVAEGAWPFADAQAWASRFGVDGTRFARYVEIERTAPGLSELLELWRRNLISDGDFLHGLRKARLEQRWDAPLEGLREKLLSPEDLAMARQQGFVDEGRAHSESALQGTNNERADLMFEMAGLPPGVETALQMLRRGIVGESEFSQIVREGHTKTKYTDELLQMRRVLLSAAENVGAAIRGWITPEEAHARNAQLGYSQADSQLLYDTHGRPPGPGQLQTAFNRGIIDQARFDHGIRESDVRPEWLDVEFALRHRYPSLFQLRGAVQDGGITPERALVIMRYEGYEPQDAQAIVASWTTAADPKKDTRVKAWQNRALTVVNKAYLTHRIDGGAAESFMASLGIESAVRDRLMTIWAIEREVPGAGLTRAQIKKAYRNNLLTYQQATADLEDLGMEAPDADIYLKE